MYKCKCLYMVNVYMCVLLLLLVRLVAVGSGTFLENGVAEPRSPGAAFHVVLPLHCLVQTWRYMKYVDTRVWAMEV